LNKGGTGQPVPALPDKAKRHQPTFTYRMETVLERTQQKKRLERSPGRMRNGTAPDHSGVERPWLAERRKYNTNEKVCALTKPAELLKKSQKVMGNNAVVIKSQADANFAYNSGRRKKGSQG